jgi:histidinol-phosphate aminotransferase
MRLDPARVIDAARAEKARLVIFSNPCNPTGQGVPREEVLRIVESCAALLVLDEAYMDFWDQSVLSEVNRFDNLIVLRTFSKAFSSAAIRLGFGVSGPELISEIKKAKSPYNVNTLTQLAGSVILDCGEEIAGRLREIRETRAFLYGALKEIERRAPGKLAVYETAANFIFMASPDADRVDSSSGKRESPSADSPITSTCGSPSAHGRKPRFFKGI